MIPQKKAPDNKKPDPGRKRPVIAENPPSSCSPASGAESAFQFQVFFFTSVSI
jgi:hypothetical protein